MTVPRIVMPTPFFYPAYKSGGVAKSLSNLIDAMGDEYRFEVHCLDSDIDGSKLALPGKTASRGLSLISYHDPEDLTLSEMRRWMRGATLLYLNGFFERSFSLKIAAARKTLSPADRPPLLIAPRGEVYADALQLKRLKKGLAIFGLRTLGLYRDAHWQASTQQEVKAIADMSARLGQREARISTACDIIKSDVVIDAPPDRRPLQMVFFSRISVKKNLDFALKCLFDVQEPFALDVIGTAEDVPYLQKCRALAAKLPARHAVRFLGPVPPEEVGRTLARYDLYFFPTRFENFGHTIQEAMAAGLPVLTSDQTPWRDLQKAEAGWDLPLREAEFVKALEDFATTTHERRLAMRDAARAFSSRFGREQAVEDHKEMFATAMASS